jgi:hypothetical protein
VHTLLVKSPQITFTYIPSLLSFAMAEMHIILATMFRRFDLKLVETHLDDIEFARDFMLPMPKAGHRNVKVVINGIRS